MVSKRDSADGGGKKRRERGVEEKRKEEKRQEEERVQTKEGFKPETQGISFKTVKDSLLSGPRSP